MSYHATQAIYHVPSHQSYHFLPSITACPDSIEHVVPCVSSPAMAPHRTEPPAGGARGSVVNAQLTPPRAPAPAASPPCPSTSSHGRANRFVITDTRRERHYPPFAAVTPKPGTGCAAAPAGIPAAAPQRAAARPSCLASGLTPGARCEPRARAGLPSPPRRCRRRDAACAGAARPLGTHAPHRAAGRGEPRLPRPGETPLTRLLGSSPKRPWPSLGGKSMGPERNGAEREKG